MATYSYIDSQGKRRTVEAPDSTAALAGAEDIARNSGVQLVQPETNTINLGQIDTTAVPLPNSALQTATPPTVAPIAFASVPPVQETEEQRLIRERERLQGEISTIENRISTSAQRRETALDEVNVFDDVRRLNELRAEQRRIEDRAIEIPIEARQQLRGRGATRTELAQTTAPRLENQALQALASSRNVSALTDTINTNIALIDSRVKAEKEADEFIYTARMKQLETIENSYSTLLSDQQKLKLEEQKAIAAADKEARDREWAIIQRQADIAAERGDDVTAARIISSRSAAEAYRLNGQVTGQTRADNAVNFVDMIDGVLNSPGISGAVGSNFLSRGLLGTTAKDFGKESEFIAKYDQLLESLTNQAIIDMRAQATGLGTFTDKDRDGLANAQIAVAARERGERINMSEAAFKDALNAVKRVQMKNYILAKIGKQAFDAAGWRDKPDSDIEDFFNLKKNEENTQNQGAGSPYESYFGNVSGNLPQRNNNPGNVKSGGLAAVDALAVGRDSQGHLIFPNAQAGFQAMALDLQAKLSGNSRYVPANPTIAQLGKAWAEDPNWANAVARIAGVTPQTKANDISFENLLRAIATQEGYYA